MHRYLAPNYSNLNTNAAPLLVIVCQMSKTFTGGAVCREFESEAAAAEEMLDRVVCSSSFQMCLESVDGL